MTNRPRPMTQLQLPIVEGVASRIEQLLQRCDALKRGSECDRPVYFDERGERHARDVAAADAKCKDLERRKST